jgi:hypothetical protein
MARARRLIASACAFAGAVPALAQPQHALQPASEQAAQVAALSWWLFGVGVLVLLGVTALLHERALIAGRHPNTPENAARFILDPQAMAPGSAMPRTIDDEALARAVAQLLHRAD